MNFDKIISNNLIDHLIISDFDYEKFKNVELCLGIDEAGRGPVLGTFNKSFNSLYRMFDI